MKKAADPAVEPAKKEAVMATQTEQRESSKPAAPVKPKSNGHAPNGSTGPTKTGMKTESAISAKVCAHPGCDAETDGAARIDGLSRGLGCYGRLGRRYEGFRREREGRVAGSVNGP